MSAATLSSPLANLPSGLDRGQVERIVREIVLRSHGLPPTGASRNGAASAATPQLVVSISARHCHLTD